MKKILLIVGDSMSANGICAKSIINKLKCKYKIFVIEDLDSRLSQREINESVNTTRVKPRLSIRLNIKGERNKDFGSVFYRKFAYILNKLKLIISLPTWPLVSPLYSYRIYKAAKKIYNSERYDYIISIYNPIDSLIVGMIMKRKYPRIKFIPYFLDSLSGGHRLRIFNDDWKIKRGLKWERWLLKSADKIVLMESSREHHINYSSKESYFNRMEFLDIPMLTNIEKRPENKNSTIEEIQIVYVGSIPCHIRNPKYTLEILKRLQIGKCKIRIIGKSTCPDLIKKYQLESKVNLILIEDFMPHGDVIQVLENSDILLNIGNNIPNMVPSKIFEYMSFGKPIISTYSIDNEPSKSYLKCYPLALVIEEDWDNIELNVKKVEKFILETLGKRINYDGIKKIYYKNTPEAFVDVIRKMD